MDAEVKTPQPPAHVPVPHPFAELLGLQMERREYHASECSLVVTPQLLNPNGVIHGAALYALADTGMGGALMPALDAGQILPLHRLALEEHITVWPTAWQRLFAAMEVEKADFQTEPLATAGTTLYSAQLSFQGTGEPALRSDESLFAGRDLQHGYRRLSQPVIQR